MDVVVALDHRFQRTPDGKIWAQTMFAYPFWCRYLEVFDQVRVVARVRDIPVVKPDWLRADGNGVIFTAIPHYVGPYQFIRRYRAIRSAVSDVVKRQDAVILRVSSMIASLFKPKLNQSAHPYAVEVVGDPYDVFSPGAFKHPLRPYLRWSAPRGLRNTCIHAFAAAYVTDRALQRRYPCPGYSVGISDVELHPEAFVATPRPAPSPQKTMKLITVGSLNHFYKAPDILLDAVSFCVKQNLSLELIFVGDGKHRQELENRAASNGIKEKVIFLGQLTSGEPVRTQLDNADIFILPSRQEGLPRAMIEAMARALPVIGSTVGGIPELLPPEDMVPTNEVNALAEKIKEIVTDPYRMVKMSARNLDKAKNYREEVLHDRRVAFYQYVRTKTENWLQSTQK
jgi:L-malate glycosyltransferase